MNIKSILVTILLVAALAGAETAQDHYQRGQRAHQEGDYAGAVRELETSLRGYPELAETYRLLGLAYYQLGNTIAAVEALENYLRLRPEDAKTQIFLAQLMNSLPVPDKAVAALPSPTPTPGQAPPSKPGSIIIFTDRLARGVKLKAWAGTTTEVIDDNAAFGRSCIKVKGNPQHKWQGVTLPWGKAWPKKKRVLPGDLRPLRERGALIFWLKGKNGSENFNLTLTNPKEKNYRHEHSKEKQRFCNTLNLARYVFTTTAWQKVIVPISEFYSKGSLWGRYRDNDPSLHYNEFRWDQVEELRLAIGEINSAEYVYYLDELRLVPEYSQHEYNGLLEQAREVRYAKAGDGKGNIVIFDDHPRAGWHGAGPEPYSRLIIDETTSRQGKKSLQAIMDPRKYSWANIGMDHLDLEPLLERGFLQLWVKGKNGGEQFTVGFSSLTSDGMRVDSTLDIGSYTIVTDKWRKIKIPLADFPLTGKTYWPREMTLPFNWKSIHLLTIGAAPVRESESAWWLDEITIQTK